MNSFEVTEIRNKLNLTQEAFAKLAGVSTRTVQNWEGGAKIPKSKHAFLRNLLYSDSNTNPTNANVINEPTETIENSNGNKFVPLKNGKFKIIVKKVPVKAFGSYLSDFQNVEFQEDLEEVSFTVDHIGRGSYKCFEVEGNSMWSGGGYDAPEGAELLGRELQRHHWKDGFKESIYGWVIVHKHTVVYKDITGFNHETGDIVCHSRSGLPNHGDFTINLNDVREIWKVIKRTF